jgi:pimeloyl-ACP methyl ester carboxylesterase
MTRDAVSPRHHKALLGAMTLHYVEAGPADADVVVLLHGWPETWFAWRHVIPRFADRYRVIAPDLRGFGDSSKPGTGYDMASLAGDIAALLDRLGVASAHVVGHDYGAATGYALAARWPERVRSLAILDMLIPGFGLEDMVRFSPSGWGLWHIPFHCEPDVPEMLIAGREREYLAWFLRNHSHNPEAVGEEALAVYAAHLRRAGGIRGAFGVYRALYESAEQNRALAARKLGMPVLALGGAMSMGDGVAAWMRGLAENVESDLVPESGHWIVEEQPEWLAARLLTFFNDGSA